MPRPISNVERVMDEYRTRILLKDADQMVIMSQRWLEVENAIMGRITALTQQAADLTRQGITRRRNERCFKITFCIVIFRYKRLFIKIKGRPV